MALKLTTAAHRAALFCAIAGPLFLFVPRAAARVTRIAIDETQSPTYQGASFGNIGTYERITGRAFVRWIRKTCTT